MRWEALFADLQAQWDAARRAEDEARVADLAEVEMGRTFLADRLRARRNDTVTLRLSDGSEVAGLVLDAAPQWLLLRTGPRRCVVPVTAVAAAWPLGAVAPEPGPVERKLGVGHVLRAVAREGAAVRIRSAGLEVRGRIVRVGADHLDVAPVPPASAGGAFVVSIAFGGLLVVESS